MINKPLNDSPFECYASEDPDIGHITISGCEGSVYVKERLALAVICLHGQPFGFSIEDVAILDDVLAFIDGMESGCDLRIKSIIDRITALLPP